jgi:hypothetical protein
VNELSANKNAASGNYATTWDELAQRLSVSRKSIQNWRSRERAGELPGPLPIARADGRHDVAAWADCMVRYQLKRADEHVDPDDLDDDAGELRTVQDWKKYREQLMCTQLERSIAKDDGKLLVAPELEVPLGAMLAAFQTKLSQFPARVARFVRGLRDENEVEDRLRDEMDADLADLQAARYIDASIPEILDQMPFDEESERLFKLVTFEGQDRAALLELIGHVVTETLRRIGRHVVKDLRNEDDPITTTVAPDPDLKEAPAAPKKTAAPKAKPKKARTTPAAAPAEIEGAIVNHKRRRR